MNDDPKLQAKAAIAEREEELEKVQEVDSRCRLLLVPLFCGSSRFESLILSYHFRFQRYM